MTLPHDTLTPSRARPDQLLYAAQLLANRVGSVAEVRDVRAVVLVAAVVSHGVACMSGVGDRGSTRAAATRLEPFQHGAFCVLRVRMEDAGDHAGRRE